MGKHGADLTGQRFGRLVALERLPKRSGGRYLWRCRCDCGRELNVRADALRSGNTKSCGCSRRGKIRKDLTGRRFGALVVIEWTEEKSCGHALWRCRCDCGQELKVRSDALCSGNTKSCGCAKRECAGSNVRDITGMRFGSLVADYPLTMRRGRRVQWHCRCDCGKEAVYTANELIYCGVRSCGCGKQYNLPTALHDVGGTCVEQPESRKLRSDNTSGCTGVSREKNGWRAQIKFQGKCYFLGLFDEYEDAVTARKRAEEFYFANFLRWYYSTHPTESSSAKRLCLPAPAEEQ